MSSGSPSSIISFIRGSAMTFSLISSRFARDSYLIQEKMTTSSSSRLTLLRERGHLTGLDVVGDALLVLGRPELAIELADLPGHLAVLVDLVLLHRNDEPVHVLSHL